MPLPREIDESFMRRAIRLAMNGRGSVEPNPMVGCVIVKDDRVIGEGFHQQYGGPHAEPNALAACTESPEGATAYVTLEPCCHTNKKTPPCVPALTAAKLARVVIGCFDPNPEVNGNGAAMLREAGVRVDGPVLGAQCQQLIALFTSRVHGGPYVTLKWAETADRKVAGPGGRRLQISGPAATRLVHRLRARCDAILVGINTVLADDPMLTPRGVPLRHRPMRIVLDRQLRIPLTSQLVRTAREWPTVVICPELANILPARKRLEAAGVQVQLLFAYGPEPDWERSLLFDVLRDKLHVHGELLVEPGPTLARALLPDARVDRAWVIRSPRTVDDPTAPPAATVPPDYVTAGEVDLAGDHFTEYLNPASAVFFAPEPSADFVLARETA